MVKFVTNASGVIWWPKFAINASGATWWPNLDSMQVAFYLAGEITQVIDSIPWVRCASGNVYLKLLPEGPWSVVDGQRITSMENETSVKGQEWVNHAYEVREVLRKITFSNKHCPNNSLTPFPRLKGGYR